jgi:hypothetical protein
MPQGVQRWPWFAVAFALYPLLYIATANPGQVSASSLALGLLVAAGASVVLLAALRHLLGDWTRAGLGAAWFAILFFSYGPFNAMLGRPAGDPDTEVLAATWLDDNLHLVHSTIWLLLLALGWLRLRRLSRPPEKLASALNVVAALLLTFAFLQWVAAGDADEAPGRELEAAARTPDAPDVYFIVLDGYARGDVLAEYYAFDNGPFVRGLEQRGFQVADASKSNYNWTFLSLASTLNMDYLPALFGAALDPDGTDREQAYRLLRDNRAADFLRARGYRYVHLQSTWGGTGTNPFADDFLRCGEGLMRDDFLLAVEEVSWLRVFGAQATFDLASCHLQNFETLAGLASEPGPKFVFAHFVPPHHPYLFDREGRVLRNANLSNQFEFQKRLWEDRAGYVDQLAFVNRKVEQAIDRIIADSSRPPVIVLISDHGPNLRKGLATAEHYRIRLANLSAVRLPGAPADLVPEDFSNVNLFRMVFDRAFGADLPRLPDRHFVSSFQQPFRFVEVGADGVRIEPGTHSADNM